MNLQDTMQDELDPNVEAPSLLLSRLQQLEEVDLREIFARDANQLIKQTCDALGSLPKAQGVQYEALQGILLLASFYRPSATAAILGGHMSFLGLSFGRKGDIEALGVRLRLLHRVIRLCPPDSLALSQDAALQRKLCARILRCLVISEKAAGISAGLVFRVLLGVDNAAPDARSIVQECRNGKDHIRLLGGAIARCLARLSPKPRDIAAAASASSSSGVTSNEEVKAEEGKGDQDDDNQGGGGGEEEEEEEEEEGDIEGVDEREDPEMLMLAALTLTQGILLDSKASAAVFGSSQKTVRRIILALRASFAVVVQEMFALLQWLQCIEALIEWDLLQVAVHHKSLKQLLQEIESVLPQDDLLSEAPTAPDSVQLDDSRKTLLSTWIKNWRPKMNNRLGAEATKAAVSRAAANAGRRRSLQWANKKISGIPPISGASCTPALPDVAEDPSGSSIPDDVNEVKAESPELESAAPLDLNWEKMAEFVMDHCSLGKATQNGEMLDLLQSVVNKSSEGSEAEWQATAVYQEGLVVRFCGSVLQKCMSTEGEDREIELSHAALDMIARMFYVFLAAAPTKVALVLLSGNISGALVSSTPSSLGAIIRCTCSDDAPDQSVIAWSKVLETALRHCPLQKNNPGSEAMSDAISSLLLLLEHPMEDVYNLTVNNLLVLDHAATENGCPGPRVMLRQAMASMRGTAELSTRIIEIVNGSFLEQTQPNVRRAALSFIEHAFRANDEVEFFYANDIHVLIEVIISSLHNTTRGDPIVLDMLLCLAAILSWKGYNCEPCCSHKLPEIAETLQGVIVSNMAKDETAIAASAAASAVHKLSEQEGKDLTESVIALAQDVLSRAEKLSESSQ